MSYDICKGLEFHQDWWDRDVLKFFKKEKDCPEIPKKYRKQCWRCDGKGYTEELRICFGDPGSYTEKHKCSTCCGRGYLEDTHKKNRYQRFRTKKIKEGMENMTTPEFINKLLNEKEKGLEDKLRKYSILTYITPEQEKEALQLVDEIKVLRKHRSAFNNLVED